jgi:hypothetical protein
MTVRDDVLRFLREPGRFSAEVTDQPLWLSGLQTFALPSIASKGDRVLRPAQEAAWRGLADVRAGLILGPPGTGKTHLLSWLIAGHAPAYTAAGRTSRVLVTAFTKSAIGNVLDAVAKRHSLHEPDAPRPIYFGEPPAAGLSDRVDCLGRGDEAQLLAELASGRAVVGATVWSLYRLLSSGLAPDADGPTAPLFDLICIDEASQMVLGQGLMALGGLAKDGRLVVSGDDQQLPPVRAAREIAVGGRQMGGSLYAFMKSADLAEFALEETFRLNGPLAAFPERKFYPGRYVSADPMARLTLQANWREGLDLATRSALDPEFPIIVFLHDGPSASTANPFEAALAARLAGALAERVIEAGGAAVDSARFWSEFAAVVSPHRAQNAAIRQMLPAAIRDGAFVETVDRIQGKERDVVILSYCVSDPEFALAEADFIFSSERLNVASTRARFKLVLIVSRALLEAVPTEQTLMDKAEILRELMADPEARSRQVAVLYQDFTVRGRMRRLGRTQLSLDEFRRRLAVAAKVRHHLLGRRHIDGRGPDLLGQPRTTVHSRDHLDHPVEGLVVGGPAFKVGKLEVSDRVIGVAQGADGEFVDAVEMKLSDIVDLIRGEIGTIVRLKVIPKGKEGEIKLVDIMRDKIDLKDSLATADLIITKDPVGAEQKLGWITLPSFYADMDGVQTSTTTDVRRLLTRGLATGLLFTQSALMLSAQSAPANPPADPTAAKDEAKKTADKSTVRCTADARSDTALSTNTTRKTTRTSIPCTATITSNTAICSDITLS